ncbi:hypothetical protein N7509_002347 [Penicillium cosmopolitanum]|uniref:Major facilitator superfamily (MFS) profile domain-containing protein n=1 Tax=Penicillium cosmopolitanum TaxID=1131564 RepID=A0A9X0BDE2_9EURO|nr:uncharacterized protein N7509_002347 [Penicillium cosmopolitanum]KAJ5408464.1 hypothetical protein N7509_002347 [Penicillium cosmopolitanum]
MYAGDKLGRRRSILIGCGILLIGAIIQTASYSLAQMIVGCVVAGVGNGMNTIAISIWQTETARPKDRVDELRLYLYAPLDCDLALSLAFQYFFAIVTVALVLITPESPRWLIMKNRVSEAQNILARLLSKQYNDAVVVSEIQHLVASVHHEAEVQESVALKEIFTFNSKQQKLRRMFLGAGTAFFQQVGGTNVIAYYLPVVLTRSVGLSSRMALILSAVDSMSLMFWGSMAALLTDRVGRKKADAHGRGCQQSGYVDTGCGFYFRLLRLLWNVAAFDSVHIPRRDQFSENAQHWNSFATTVNWIFVYVVVATPTAIENIQWRYYMLYAIFNFCFIPLIYYFYVETATLSLEQVDRLFEIKHDAGKDMSWADATRIARTENDDLQTPVEKDILSAEHCEIAP